MKHAILVDYVHPELNFALVTDDEKIKRNLGLSKGEAQKEVEAIIKQGDNDIKKVTALFGKYLMLYRFNVVDFYSEMIFFDIFKRTDYDRINKLMKSAFIDNEIINYITKAKIKFMDQYFTELDVYVLKIP